MEAKNLDNLKALSCAALGLILSTPAVAQERAEGEAAQGQASAEAATGAEPDWSNELVVTARRQSETITDVPATVNVVSDEALSARLVGSGLDLSGITPGFQLYNALGGSAAPTIRGLGSNTAVFSIEASVASFFDGVYAAHPRDYVSPIFDVDRIEVIKGTQSTTLGKNITLGAVSFVSRRPGDDLGFDITASHEFKFNSTRLEGGVDIPLSDTLRVRLAGYYNNEGGYVRNRLRGIDEPTRKIVGGRMVAVWEPTDSLSATLIYQHDRYKEAGQNIHLLRDGLGVPGSVSIRQLAASIGQTDFAVGPLISYNGYPDRPPYDDQKSHRATLIIAYELGEFTLSSQTAYVNWKDRRRNDLDFTAASMYTFQVTEPNELFSQELRLSSPVDKPFSYVGGVYYLWNKWGVDQVLDFQAPWPRTGALNHFYEQDVNSYSGFVQVNASPLEAIKLAAGARYTRETKGGRFFRTELRPGSATAIFAPFPEFSLSRKENNLDWSLSAQYYLDSRNVIYASASRGSKSGGFQTLPSNPALTEFEGEQALTYEVGVKLQPAGTLSLELALYNTTVKDFQYNINTSLGNVITNVKVRTRGVDTSFNWRPFPGMRLQGGVVYADAINVDAFPGAPAGTRAVRAPKWTGTVAAYYETALSPNLDLNVNPFVDFSSSQDHQLPSFNAPRRQAYGLVNLRVAVGPPDKNWEIALVGKNLTNQKSVLSATIPTLANGPFFGSIQTPRTFALQLSVRR